MMAINTFAQRNALDVYVIQKDRPIHGVPMCVRVYVSATT